jgi:hypothetical protein
MANQNLEVLVRDNSVLLTSENVSFEGKVFQVSECVFRRNLRSIHFVVLIFTVIILSELSVSIRLDPMLYTLNGCSSRLMRDKDSQSFNIQVNFLSFSTQKFNKAENDISIESIMVNQYSNFSVHPFWEVQYSLEAEPLENFNQIVL